MQTKNVLTTRTKRLLAVLVTTAVLILALGVSLTLAETGPGVPDSGTVAGVGIRTFYLSALDTVTATTTIYASSARETGDNVMYAYHSFDVFAALDISGTGAITITPQVSADNVNWVDVTYSYVGTPLNYSTTSTATTVSTSTATVTNIVSTSGTPTVYEATQQIVLDADGETDYFVMPMTGYYLRFKMVYSATGTMTPTIKAVGRND